MQNKNLEEYNQKSFIEINGLLNEIKNTQKCFCVDIKKNQNIIVKKLGKLQEYNEICDMTNQVFEIRISNIELILAKILEKVSI